MPEDHDRTAELVLERLRAHPLLQPLRDADQRLLIGCNEEAIWARAVPSGPDTYEFEVCIAEPGWWDAGPGGADSLAEGLAGRLADGLRTKWDARRERTESQS